MSKKFQTDGGQPAVEADHQNTREDELNWLPLLGPMDAELADDNKMTEPTRKREICPAIPDSEDEAAPPWDRSAQVAKAQQQYQN